MQRIINVPDIIPLQINRILLVKGPFASFGSKIQTIRFVLGTILTSQRRGRANCKHRPVNSDCIYMRTRNRLCHNALVSLLVFGGIGFMLTQNGCATQHDLPTPEKVDLDSFMGPWFVIAFTPLLVDDDAHNGVEHYYLAEDGDILTTYEFNKGAFDGPLKTYTPTGRVAGDSISQAEWKMQFIWPFSADYLILHVDAEYSETIVVHPNRKYAWVMHRKPRVAEATYARLEKMLIDNGFDHERLQPMPQDWGNDEERLNAILELGASAPLKAR